MLAWIIAFKAFKALTLTALGVALLSTRDADPVNLFMRLAALALHVPLTSRLLDRVLAFLADLTMTSSRCKRRGRRVSVVARRSSGKIRSRHPMKRSGGCLGRFVR